jgi:hypothetical protein
MPVVANKTNATELVAALLIWNSLKAAMRITGQQKDAIHGGR